MKRLCDAIMGSKMTILGLSDNLLGDKNFALIVAAATENPNKLF